MLVAKTSVGAHAILIETLEEDIEIIAATAGRQTELTGIEDSLGDAYTKVKDVIMTMATDFAKDLKSVVASGQKIELEFSLSLSATNGLWIMSGKGEAAIKVTMVWEASKG